MYGRSKYHLWLTSLIVALSLLTGAVFGLLVRDLFAGEAVTFSPAAPAMPVSSTGNVIND